MAGEIEIHKILLYDKWPGEPNPNLGIPAGGWDSTLYSACQSVPAYPPGTKIQAYQDHTYCEGQYTMCYMCFHESSDWAYDVLAMSDTQNAVICGDVGGEGNHGLVVLDGSYGDGGLLDYTESVWWIVTNSYINGDVSATGRVAVPVGGMSEGEFGWFWVGGVCPVGEVTFYDAGTPGGGDGSELPAAGGTIAMGSKLMPVDSTGGIVLSPWDGTYEFTPCGLALDADL